MSVHNIFIHNTPHLEQQKCLSNILWYIHRMSNYSDLNRVNCLSTGKHERNKKYHFEGKKQISKCTLWFISFLYCSGTDQTGDVNRNQRRDCMWWVYGWSLIDKFHGGISCVNRQDPCTGLPCIALHFIVLRRCCIFFTCWRKKITTHLIVILFYWGGLDLSPQYLRGLPA